jgi:hypothetical protein
MTSSSSGVMTAFAGGGEKGNMAQRIANFIGVPFKDRRPPTVQETVEAISKGIAKGMQKKD